MLAGFYTAFSPACFTLLGLWIIIIQINAAAWLSRNRQKQAYAVALYFAAPGTMSLLALIDPLGSVVWRAAFITVSVLGILGMFLLGSPHRQRHHDALQASDQLAHWIAIALYAAIAVLTIPALNALRVEAVLLTVLVLLGVHLALRLMFATGAPSSGAEAGSSALAGDGRPVTFGRAVAAAAEATRTG
jgi:hypothetical protein